MEEVLVMANEGGEANHERKVMIAIDESEFSHYALIWALDNLKESLAESSLLIFMAQPPARSLNFPAAFGAARMYCTISTDFVDSVKERNTKLALAYLEKAKEICAKKGVNAEIMTEEGDPRTTICNVVQKLNISMLILGEQSLGKLKRALLGTVSNYCLQYANCPVLVVRKP